MDPRKLKLTLIAAVVLPLSHNAVAAPQHSDTSTYVSCSGRTVQRDWRGIDYVQYLPVALHRNGLERIVRIRLPDRRIPGSILTVTIPLEVDGAYPHIWSADTVAVHTGRPVSLFLNFKSNHGAIRGQLDYDERNIGLDCGFTFEDERRFMDADRYREMLEKGGE